MDDLFRRDSHYKTVLNKITQQQIEEKGLRLIKEFKGISDDRDFYLADDALMVYFSGFNPACAG
ncbi:RsiV family protein [Desulfotomaculum nigrificans]|uniref:DUF3298 domain-containing protein n=1 Tax=Desulfotomaculum nigrificans TaxID=1565 RepID=UPI00059DCEF4